MKNKTIFAFKIYSFRPKSKQVEKKKDISEQEKYRETKKAEMIKIKTGVRKRGATSFL